MTETEETFEIKVKSIESILERLGKEDVALEESLRLYEEGSKKIKEAMQMLERAEILFQEIKQNHQENM